MLQINNLPTQDQYVQALTMLSARAGGGRLTFTVANAAAIMQLQQLYDPASAGAEFGPEFIITPSTGIFDAVSGVRFRSAVPGVPAQIIAQLFEKGDPIPQGANPFTGILSSSGAIGGLATGGLLNIQYLSGSGTYTPTAGAVSAVLEAIAGGGGSGATATGASGATSTGGGGAGAFSRRRLTSLAASYPFACGAGGAGGVAVAGTGGNGGNGADTTFGSGPTLVQAKGGAGSVGVATGVQGGGGFGGQAAGGIGDFYQPGGDGADGANGGGGQGGAGFYGGSSHMPLGTGVGPSGSGGHGVFGPGAAGIAGSAGVIVVYEYA